jgi:hypothetical protein
MITDIPLRVRAERHVHAVASSVWRVVTQATLRVDNKIQSWHEEIRERELRPGSIVEITATACCTQLRGVAIGTQMRVVRPVNDYYDYTLRALDDSEDYYACENSFRVLWRSPVSVKMPWRAPGKDRPKDTVAAKDGNGNVVQRPRCPATTYDRSSGHDTRCALPSGHDLATDDPSTWYVDGYGNKREPKRHDDGALMWEAQ